MGVTITDCPFKGKEEGLELTNKNFKLIRGVESQDGFLRETHE